MIDEYLCFISYRKKQTILTIIEWFNDLGCFTFRLTPYK